MATTLAPPTSLHSCWGWGQGEPAYAGVGGNQAEVTSSFEEVRSHRSRPAAGRPGPRVALCHRSLL